jgi:hypothetical protein
MTGVDFVVFAARRRAATPDGRFEYRVWPAHGHPALSRLQRAWSLVAAERRSDIYLLPATRGRTLVKLRDGDRLEIKLRTHDVGTIQHWEMPVSARFPLGRRHRVDLAEALALPDGLDAETGRSPAHLLAALGDAVPAVTAQTVRKSRVLFEHRDCRAEITRAAAGGWSRLSIALEADALPAIAMALDDLRLGDLPNLSYGAVLGPLFGPSAPWPRLLIQARSEERRPQ